MQLGNLRLSLPFVNHKSQQSLLSQRESNIKQNDAYFNAKGNLLSPEIGGIGSDIGNKLNCSA